MLKGLTVFDNEHSVYQMYCKDAGPQERNSVFWEGTGNQECYFNI